MKRFKGIVFFLLLFLSSCWPEKELQPSDRRPDGAPVTMYLGFGAQDFLDVRIGTKAEASPADEARVHDLYVMLFDSNGEKFYGHYFTYEHLTTSLPVLEAEEYEGWYVENSTSEGTQTRGVVKISSQSKSGCTLVVLANVSNSINTLDGADPIDKLAEIHTLSRLNEVKVTLEQEVVNRTNLFLMLGVKDGIDTGSLKWGELPETYDPNAKIELKTLVAKVKFYVTYDETYIDATRSEPRSWQVFNVPSSCYLMPHDQDPDGVSYFNTTEAYFDGTETYNDKEWQVFSFYMLENRQSPKLSIEGLTSPSYYLREKQDKSTPDPEGYVVNGDWTYAPDRGTYVQFDMVLGLTSMGVVSILGEVGHALTSEAVFTVHMGDFTPNGDPEQHDYDNYDVERNNAYSYYITIENSKKIYVEVKGDEQGVREDEPGQEGSLLLTTDEIVNCDAHYEYHSLTFTYNPTIEQRGVSWYVKTPFSEGGARWNDNKRDWDFTCEDYLWVKFAVNEVAGGDYSDCRKAYPGDGSYDPDWQPGGDAPVLMDIHQLILYIFDETEKEKRGENSDFLQGVIRVTAFVDEYYYEKDPTDPDATADPNLWRRFVNAKPRELHILADSKYSQDRKSDVITSSHSIIQQSIQTIYNIYSPDITSLWGTEHVDEMSYKIRYAKDPGQTQWSWWKDGRAAPSGTRDSEENGRVNTATLWNLNSGAQSWDTYLNYSVNNNTPELQEDYKYLAYSCFTRNRDNNGNTVIDPEEVRWYTAAVNQIVGMWVGNEALTPSARIYQPLDASDNDDGLKWRSWVISSTAVSVNNPRVIRAEEGGTKSWYNEYTWAGFNTVQRDKVSSIRCVRNIGTFQNAGVTTDISYAPYDHEVDKYYEVTGGLDVNGRALPNADGTYTIRFSRLNPVSIRDYSAEDLPYHQEYSEHNKVYLELHTQNPDNHVYADGSFPGEDEEIINNNITHQGYNRYCPAGYRMPNMTELLMMVSLMPSSYWSSNTFYPSRTFYSRGALGKGTTGEEEKIGWTYASGSGRVNLIDRGDNLTGIRCVKDNDCVGEISGRISVPGWDDLAVGETITIQLNITSQSSSIKELALSLVYVRTDGREGAIEIPVTGVELFGSTVRDEVEYTIPSELPILGNMYIRATVRNSVGVTRVFETPIRVKSPVFASVRLLHCDYSENDETPAFPVMVTASSPSSDITGWKLTIRDPDGETWTVSNPTLPLSGDTHNSTAIYHFDDYTIGSLLIGTYTFQLEVTTNDGKTTRSDIASMDILQVNYWPNPGVVGTDYHEAADIVNVWATQKIEGLDFHSGDFIEANMDVSNCTYKEVMKTDNPSQRDDNRTIGRDNLISIGLTDTDHGTGMSVPYVYHIFYPAHDGAEDSGQDWLRPNVSTDRGASNGYNYKEFNSTSGSGFEDLNGSAKPKMSAYQHFRFEKSGVYWNDQVMDFSYWGNNANAARTSFERLLSANTLYVGATQGYHHTRARYVFVRVVHNSASSNALGSNGTNLGNDPINGGIL